MDTEGALATADDALDRSLGKVFDPGELEERLHDIIGNEGES